MSQNSAWSSRMNRVPLLPWACIFILSATMALFSCKDANPEVAQPSNQGARKEEPIGPRRIMIPPPPTRNMWLDFKIETHTLAQEVKIENARGQILHVVSTQQRESRIVWRPDSEQTRISNLPLRFVLTGTKGEPLPRVQDLRWFECPKESLGLSSMKTVPKDYLSHFADAEAYHFAVAGHTYGRHKPVTKGLFAPLRENWGKSSKIDQAAFCVLTGDTVYRAKDDFFEALDQDLAQLRVPVFIAPGNHDSAKSIKSRFGKRYGATRQAWQIGPDEFVACNINDTSGQIAGVDLAAIQSALARKPRALFIFVHALVWVDKDRVARKLVPRKLSNTTNPKFGYAAKNDFYPKLLPILEKAGIPVFVIAGDVGAGSKVIESYEKVGENVHLVSSGMGEHPDVGTWLSFSMTRVGVQMDCHQLTANPSHHLEGVNRIPSLLVPYERE